MGDANDPGVWLQLANEEFSYASSDLDDSDHQWFAQTCFHFQQAAEKYLKAFLLHAKKPFRKVHNLTELVMLCAQHDAKFLELKDRAAILNPFYTETRYPVHWPIHFTRSDAETAMAAAIAIAELVKEKMRDPLYR